MTALTYLVHFFVYEMIILVCFAVVFETLAGLSDSLGRGMLAVVAKGVVWTLILTWLFGGSWIAHNASRRRVIEEEGFFQAVGGALSEARLNLSFVPGVGKLFRPRLSKGSPFEPPDDPA